MSPYAFSVSGAVTVDGYPASHEAKEYPMRHDRPGDAHTSAGVAPVAGSSGIAGDDDGSQPALAREPSILDRFVATQRDRGVIAEPRAMQLVYLCLTSRLLERPVSLAIEGPSSTGKSFAIDKTLEFFPPAAFYELSAMSERALAYGNEPLVHRILVLYEAISLRSQFGSYLIRSLLSEGRLRYEVTEKKRNGSFTTRRIERDGPTGRLTTTIGLRLHPENKTRLLSVPVADTPAQTKAIMRAQADEDGWDIDLEPWTALQSWLEGADQRVAIPYSACLAELIPPVAPGSGGISGSSSA